MKKLLSIALLVSPLAHADQPIPTFQDVLNEMATSSPWGYPEPKFTILSTVLSVSPEQPDSKTGRELIPVKVGIWEEMGQSKLAFAISSSTEEWKETSYYTCNDSTEYSIHTNRDSQQGDTVFIDCNSLEKYTSFQNISLFDFKDSVMNLGYQPLQGIHLTFHSPFSKMLVSDQGPISERFKVYERYSEKSIQLLTFGEFDHSSGENDNLVQEYTAQDFQMYPPVETQSLIGVSPKTTYIFYSSIHLPYGDEKNYDIATLKKKYEITATASNTNGYIMPLFNFYFASTSTDLSAVKMVLPYSFPSGDFSVNVTIKEKATGKQFINTIPGFKEHL